MPFNYFYIWTPQGMEEHKMSSVIFEDKGALLNCFSTAWALYRAPRAALLLCLFHYLILNFFFLSFVVLMCSLSRGFLVCTYDSLPRAHIKVSPSQWESSFSVTQTLCAGTCAEQHSYISAALGYVTARAAF